MEFNSIKYEDVVKDLEEHPGKKLFWRSGFAYRGAAEHEISRDPKDYPKRSRVWLQGMPEPPMLNSWKDDLKKKYDWACIVELDSNTDAEMHLNGLSENDMF